MVRTLLLLTVVLLFSACSNTDLDQKAVAPNNETENKKVDKPIQPDAIEVGYVTIDDLKLGELSVNMTYEEVVKVMGKEVKKEKVKGFEADNFYTLLYEDGTVIQMHDDKVYSVEVTEQDYLTARGLKVGDSTETVLQLYDGPSYKNETEWNYTTDDEYTLFTVFVKNDKVVKIRINLVM